MVLGYWLSVFGCENVIIGFCLPSVVCRLSSVVGGPLSIVRFLIDFSLCMSVPVVAGAARIFGKNTLEARQVNNVHEAKQNQDEKGVGPPSCLVFILCGCSAMEGADAVLLPSTFYALQHSLRLSLSHLSTMTLVEAMAMSGVAPVWGMIADRQVMTRKSILASGACLQGIILILISFMESFTVMLVLRLLNGAMLAMLRPVASGIIGDVFPEHHRGKAFGRVGMSLNLGMCLSALVCTPLSTQRVLGIDGWRFAYALIGSVSVFVGGLITCLMVEPVREKQCDEEGLDSGAILYEVQRLMQYFRMPTFCILVLQGVFGCIPWSALSYQTLFYQISGLGHIHASALQALSQFFTALGSMLGGVFGDRFAAANPHHGRPCLAQISVTAGIPVSWLMFTVLPPGHNAFQYYAALVLFMGLTASWAGTGVNWPIMTQIVEPNNRSSIMAWQAALEGSSSAIFGNAAVGFLAENVFGYNIDNAQAEKMDQASIHALGRALMLTCVVPWCLCLGTFSFLHWSYPRDLAKARAKFSKERHASEVQLEAIMSS